MEESVARQLKERKKAMKKIEINTGAIKRFHSVKIQFELDHTNVTVCRNLALSILGACKYSHVGTLANSEDQDEIPLKP